MDEEEVMTTTYGILRRRWLCLFAAHRGNASAA